jgi:hypothetical protein
MTPDAIFTIIKNGTITGSHDLAPDKTFAVTTPAEDPYEGSIYAIHLEHNATLELVGNGHHTIDIGKTYTVQRRAQEKNYQLTTTRPAPGNSTHTHASERTPETRNPPNLTGGNGDLYVGSGGG